LPVRLIRKYAERIDGVDLRAHAVGDVFDLPATDARLLIAEKWAIPARCERIRPKRRLEIAIVLHVIADPTTETGPESK
jgi:hypothetical protein